MPLISRAADARHFLKIRHYARGIFSLMSPAAAMIRRHTLRLIFALLLRARC